MAMRSEVGYADEVDMNVVEALRDARRRTLELALDLDDDQWLGPRLGIVNPMRWELGHVAWFQEHWALRHALGRGPLRANGDSLYDSMRVAHDTRWDLPLPDRASTLAYMNDVLERTLAIETSDDYFRWLAVFHEDMHGEAFTYTRQTLAYPAPRFANAKARKPAGPLSGDVDVPGGEYFLGAIRGRDAFVFDNEKWAHAVDVAPFRIARAPVTNSEFAAFVDAHGYEDPKLWSEEGWRWRSASNAQMPAYWRRAQTSYEMRRWNAWAPIAPHEPVVHVCWYEADAWCRWAGRRLPTEAEWELAASTMGKRKFPWGDAEASDLANLDGALGGPVDVAAFPESDSAFGCRQMIGNVWEWTATRFAPFAGFVADPYKEYSEPWFATPHMVLRGGCWATRARLLRNTWRNFYPPDRRDVIAGFRSCAVAR